MVEPLIDAELARFLESANSQIAASVDPNGVPEATRGWGIDVAPGGRQLRILLSARAAVMLSNLAATGALAVTATHFVTLRSVQVKGHAISVEPRTAADRIRFDEFCALCVQEVHQLDGTPEAVVWRMSPGDVVACVMDVEAVFDQTPGPAAGARVRATGA